MGSGRSGLYSGTAGSSQPYASFYAVMPDMLEYDRRSGIYSGDGYDKNPTAKPIDQMIKGNHIGDKHTNGKFIYAIDIENNIVIGKRNGNGREGLPTPHPTLIGGKNPKVKIAGILDVRGGKIYSYDDRSGHFKPNSKSLEAADNVFGKLPRSLFHKKFQNRG